MKNKNMKKLVIGGIATVLLLTSPLALAQEGEELIPEGSMTAEVDAVPPADVENVKAMAGDGAITLSWDTATDNVGVTGYKIYYGTTSVSEDEGSYTEGPLDVGNVISHEISGLDNDVSYYFAVTAYDAEGNESEFYSIEASATPESLGGDEDADAPKVVKSVATTKNTVLVTFSEKVVLPAESSESAFSIQEDLSGMGLEIISAEMDEDDPDMETIKLTTADQDLGTTYILTAGIEIRDDAGNPIVSGTSDTAAFIGSDVEDLKPAAAEETDKEPADATAPEFVNVRALSNSQIEVSFTEPVALKTDARENFIVTEELDTTAIINVNKVTVGPSSMIITLDTDEMPAGKYNLIAVQVMDDAGNEMDIEKSATSFEVVDAEPIEEPELDDEPVIDDVSVPEGAEDLVAKVMEDVVVRLSWNTTENISDIANLVVYMSQDKGATYGDGIILGTDIMAYDFDSLKEGMTYYFKLTSRNATGNESEGLETFITLTLPKTGPGLGILLLGSMGAGAVLSRKKKRK